MVSTKTRFHVQTWGRKSIKRVRINSNSNNNNFIRQYIFIIIIYFKDDNDISVEWKISKVSVIFERIFPNHLCYFKNN